MLLLVVIGLLVAVWGAIDEQRRPPVEQDTTSAGWAGRKLNEDSFVIVDNKYGHTEVKLTRDLVIEGIPCAQDSIVRYHWTGHLYSVTLSRDFDFEGTPLAASTRVDFDTHGAVSSGTLRLPTTICGVPCAAAEFRLHTDVYRRLASATLAREWTVAGIRCAAGSEVKLRSTVLWRVLDEAVPAHDIKRWGVMCAAGEVVDFEYCGGTLAKDTHWRSVVLPRGSRFSKDIDWGDMIVELSRPTDVFGHRVPRGCSIYFWDWPGFLIRRLFPRGATCSVYSPDNRWSLKGGLAIQPGQHVRVEGNGHAKVRLQSDVQLSGIVYAADTWLTIDADGNVVGWEGSQPPRSPSQGPYRNGG